MIVDPDKFMVFQLSPNGDLNSRAGARNCKLGHIPSGYNHIISHISYISTGTAPLLHLS